MNDRITGTIEGYWRNTFDLLNYVNTPLGSNFSNTVISNIGSMRNKGLELSLNVVPIETQDWHWSIGGNLTFQDVKITKLTNSTDPTYRGVDTGSGMGGTGGFTSLHRVGFSPYTFFLYEQLYDESGNPVQNGLVDRNGDGIITEDDRYVTGYSATPRAFGGLNTHVNYKNWDFSINGHGSYGNYAINKVAMGYATSYTDDASKGYINNLCKAYLVNGWNNAMSVNQKYSDYFVENASFFKIDDINLGYTFKFNRFIKTMRLAASIQNCLYIHQVQRT